LICCLSETPANVVPRIIQEVSTTETSDGYTARIPCVAHGKVPISYNWFRNVGGQLTLVDVQKGLEITDGTLVILKATLLDSGKYICVANNSLGEDRVERTLVVRGSLKVTIESTRRIVRSGEDIVLNCNVSGSPIISVSWLKDQHHLVSDHRIRLSTATTLHIAAFQRKDSGIYQCYVENDWESAQAAIQLDLQEQPPSFIRVFPDQRHRDGQFVSLQCEAIGSPIPQIDWTLDGENLPESRRVQFGDFVRRDGSIISYVNLTELSTVEGGLYGCIAHNDVGTVSHSARIEVFGPPFIRPLKNVTAVAGQIVKLRCSVSGYPIDLVYVEKDGRRLPIGDRQAQEQRGLITLHNVRKDDEGVYKCVALNNRGEKAERSFVLQVVTAPVISPFLFTDKLEEGMRNSAVCSILAGDSPIRITWFKDGIPIRDAYPDIQVVSITDFVSSLIINTVKRHHTGNYTCVASNAATSVNYTARMVVRASPKWTIKPTDQSALAGMPVTFDCQADGEPKPVVRWKYSPDGERKEYHSVLSSSRIYVLENGSLTITAAEKTDIGYYMCETSNDVGEPLREDVQLTVHSAPQIQSSTQVVQVKKSERATLSCSASGDPPLTISWDKVGFPLALYQIKRYTIEETERADIKTSLVTISHAEREDTNTYTCLASNPYGIQKTKVRLIVQETPDPPEDVRVIEVTSTAASLLWSPPYSGNSPITSYVISYKQEKEEWPSNRSRRVIVSSADTTATITGLQSMTSYNIHVFAKNSIGHSSPSKTITVTTAAEAPRNPPVNVKAVPLDSKSVRVTWEIPFRSERVQVEDFYVGYKESESTNQYIYKTVHLKKDQMTAEYTITNLKRSTKYSIVVQAFNSQGAGPASEEVIVQTFLMDPPKAPVMHIVGSTSNTISLKWETSEDNSNPINGWLVYSIDIFVEFLFLRPNNAFFMCFVQEEWPSNRSRRVIVSSADTTATITGLQSMTSYNIHVFAKNSIGHSSPSKTITVTTAAEAPRNPPVNVKAVPLDSKSVRVTWEIPFRSERVQVEDFYVGYKESESTNQYIYKTVHLKKDQMTAEYTITNLKRSTKYSIVVQAFNSQGAGPASEEVIVQTFLMDPPKAPVMHIVGSTSNTISLKWETSEDNSNPINGYILNYKDQTNEWKEIQLSSNHYHYTLENLLCGTSYQLLLIAFNDVGRGNPSETLHASTKGKAPVSPDENIFLKVNVTSVHLRLSTWADDGCPISHFVVRYKPRGHREWILVSNHILPEQDVVMIADLSPGTWHDLLITAHNDAGSTEEEYSFATLTLQGDGERKEYHSVLSSSRIYVLENGSLTITAAEKTDIGYYMCETSNDVGEPLREDVQLTVHSAPQIQSSTQVVQVKKSERATLSCSASGDPPLTISWDKVGFPLALYQIKRYTIEETERADIKTSLVTISHAEREDTNTYTCLASNPYGIQKTKVRLIVQETPDPPEDVRVIEVTSTAASLLWSPPYSGNSPITSYVISYKQEKEEWPSNRSRRVIVSSADTTATITGLQSMTSYNIHVFAKNSIGHSSPSKTITVTTAAEAPRNPPVNVKAVPLDSKSVRVTWEIPFRSERVQVEDFYVGYKESESTNQYIYKTVHLKKDQMTAEYTITNLKRSTKYSIVVQAFNSQGAGPASEEVIVQTFLMDPPKAPVMHIVGSTSNTISLKWETSEDNSNPINGYILNYKDQTNEWKEIQLSSNHYHYTLENLLCGTSYQLLLIAFNDVGRGNPSETLHASTKGKAPVSPDENIFLKVNVTSVHLRLSTWADDGCPISHFVVRYKPRGHREWILVSNHILPEQDVVMIADLSPGTWHDLLITAHNDAGSTEEEYSFATLTLQGGNF
ncbi:Down syndrome cell adhesion molecule-like protein Dscam2, partial [Centruroides sculpturatus]|uniref:Down syndrome cell adhesion molecule-like protein Dscam2 n=1 Tax=Centruroides sculpturatus TaxID=218467 RepID=UPI000C6CC55E